jgi:hypothetical protein
MNAIVASLVLLGAMTALVVFTMAVENWSRIIEPLAPMPEGDELVEEFGEDEPPAAEAARTPGPAAPSTTRPVAAPAIVAFDAADLIGRPDDVPARRPVERPLVTAAGRPDGAVSTEPGSLHLRDADTADVLTGLLFAAYAASRKAAADRAAAWVTVAATPPTADPTRFPPGVRLRGRPARVAELLGFRDGGCTWVTLQPNVDIAAGLARTPVKQDTLAGLVAWWERSQQLPAVINPTDAARIARSIEAIRPQLDATPWTEPVGLLLAALTDAAAAHETLLVDVGRRAATVAERDPGPARRRPAAPSSR